MNVQPITVIVIAIAIGFYILFVSQEQAIHVISLSVVKYSTQAGFYIATIWVISKWCPDLRIKFSSFIGITNINTD